MCSQSSQFVLRRRMVGVFFFFFFFFFYIISLNNLGVRIKRTCLRMYGELVSKEFSFQFTRKCMTSSKRDQVFSAAEHLCHAAISKPYQ